MQAIQVKYLPPTYKIGSRFKATASSGSVTVPTDYGLDYEPNARKAAEALLKKLGWHNVEISGSGGLPNCTEVFTLKDVD
jgi:hypothetical protein